MTSGKQKALIFLVSGVALLLAACQQPQTTPTSPAQTQPPAVQISSPTPLPSPTTPAIPAAGKVNSEIIPLSYFQNEVLRYQDANPDATDAHEKVWNSLVDQQLLSQAAKKAGFSMTAADLQTKIDDLLAQLGSGSALTNWMQTNHYDDAEFRYALTLAAEAAWERDQIIATVPATAEQVHARQIFANTQAGADRALASLNSGKDFDALAWEYSPLTGGELGWFPRGYLLNPQVEEAAFSLAEGSFSDIIKSDVGFHIIMVIEHSADHPLSTDARLSLQSKALADWLVAQRAQAVIEKTLP